MQNDMCTCMCMDMRIDMWLDMRARRKGFSEEDTTPYVDQIVVRVHWGPRHATGRSRSNFTSFT